VALTAFYNTETQGFATTFFNKTITIVEQPRIIDFELIFLWLLMLGLLGGGGPPPPPNSFPLFPNCTTRHN